MSIVLSDVPDKDDLPSADTVSPPDDGTPPSDTPDLSDRPDLRAVTDLGGDSGSAPTSKSAEMSRRTFLHRGTVLAAGLGVATAVGIDRSLQSGSSFNPRNAQLHGGTASSSSDLVPPRDTGWGVRTVSSETSVLPSGVVIPTSPSVIAENAIAGTPGWWVTTKQSPRAIEGFASAVSAVPGDDVTLFVNTNSPQFHVEAYRMGYYQGIGARLIWRSDIVPGRVQPPPTFTGGINMVECHWQPSLSFNVGVTWPPGDYLLKLVGANGEQQFVPLCIRDDASTAAFVLQNSVTTWQAYNLWGGYSLYYGALPGGGQDFAQRSRVVSFDRPYQTKWANGAADFIGNEFPLLYQAERLGLDITYWTDVDFHQAPARLLQHRALLSMGHDEYWSSPMHEGALFARDLGVNFAFLGANACYRQIRFEGSPVGPNRRQICYKSASEDPLFGINNALVTVNWPDDPVPRPESELIGAMYQSVGADADLVIGDASSWLWNGTGFTDGQSLPHAIQGEYDRYVPSYPGPTNLDILAHSPIGRTGNWSDITWYTSAGAGGVFASGSASFVNKLSATSGFPANIVPAAIPGITEPLLRAMENLFSVLGLGPAGSVQPSSGNWTTYYRRRGSASLPPEVNSA